MKRFAIIIMLLIPAQLWGQTPKFTGPEKVEPGSLIHLTIDIPESWGLIFESIPDDLFFVQLDQGTTRNFICAAGCATGKTIVVKAIYGRLENGRFVLNKVQHKVSVEGTTPVPPPPPPPPPDPSQGVRVMILIEESEPSKIPAAQAQALTDVQVITTLNSKCEKLRTSDGQMSPAWRKFDDDLTDDDIKLVPDPLKALYKRGVADSKGKVPWIVTQGPKGITSQEYPKTISEAISFFQAL